MKKAKFKKKMHRNLFHIIDIKKELKKGRGGGGGGIVQRKL